MRNFRLSYAIFSWLICFALMMAGCDSGKTVSTSGQLDARENPFKEPESIAEVPTIAYIKGFKDYCSIIDKNRQFISNTFVRDKVDMDFLKWLKDNYGNDVVVHLARGLDDGIYSDRLWHNETGCTFHVLWDYYNENSDDAVVCDGKSEQRIILDFAGDLCLSENWYTLNKYDESGGVLNRCISQELIDRLNAADIFMLNNEFTFSDRGSPLSGKYYTFRASVQRISILKELGADVVSVANNHVYDYGSDAFFDTLSTLSGSGIKYFGAGKNIDDASKPVYFIINGIKIGFVGASCAEKIRFTPGADSDSPGVLLTYDDSDYLKVISSAKSECDYLVAYVHWGTEDSHTVKDYQRVMGKQFIDAGADTVIGGHPHVLQGIEYYNGKPIFYSLGDFWFNYETKETGIAEIELTSTGVNSIRFLPCIQENYSTSLVTDSESSAHIYSLLNDLSSNANVDSNGYITQK